MATKGTFTAYQQLNPLQGSVADDMANQDNLAFRRRAEQREIDAIAQEKADKKRKEKQQLIDSVVKNIQNYNSGSRTLDEIKGRAIQRAMDEYGPIIETLENPNSSSDQILKAKLKLQNLHNLPENMKMVTDFYTEQDKVYREGVAKGTLFKDNEYERIFQEGFGNYHIDIDENGLPVVALMNKDINKDGKIDVYDVQDFQQIKTGLPTFNFQNRYDYEELIKDATNKILPSTTQTDNGVVQNKKTGLDLIKAKTYAEGMFLQQDGSPTPKMISVAKERGIDITKPEGQQKIINDFVSRMSLGTKTEDITTRKDSALDWMKERRAAAKDAKENEKNKTTYEVVETPPKYAEAKINSAKGYKTVSVINSASVPLIEGYVLGKKQEFTNAKINSYTVVKNKIGNRQIVAEIIYEDVKRQNKKDFSGTDETTITQGSQNKSKIVTLTQKDAIKFAKQMGFESTTEMANQAKVNEKYTSVEESAIQQGMKDNPGVSREIIVKELGL